MSQPVTIGFWCVAIGLSVFLGWTAPTVFDVKVNDWAGPKKVQQFLLNFVGSLVGWGILWLQVLRLWPAFSGQAGTSLCFADYVAILAAFLGITGYLPFLIVGCAIAFVQGFGKLAQSLVELASKKLSG